MIRQPAVIVESAQVRAADVAHLEFLVAGGAGGVGEGLEFALAVGADGLSLTELEVLGHGEGDAACAGEDLDFFEAGDDCFC